jgi:hypothetical protein
MNFPIEGLKKLKEASDACLTEIIEKNKKEAEAMKLGASANKRVKESHTAVKEEGASVAMSE